MEPSIGGSERQSVVPRCAKAHLGLPLSETLDERTTYFGEEVGATTTLMVERIRERRLELKGPVRVEASARPVRYLGYIVSREGLSLAPSTLRRVRRRAAALRAAPAERVARSLASWRGLPLLVG